MAGLKLEQMGLGRSEFFASLTRPDFPAIESRERWDRHNARALRAIGIKGESKDARRALGLAETIYPVNSNGIRSPVPTTMASARARLRAAEQFGAHAWEVCEGLAEPAHFFTGIPRYGEVYDPGEIDPELFKERFRAELNAAGASGAGGILMAVIEAEYQMRTGKWFFHWHGIASGGKLAAFDNLRDLPAYYSPRREKGEPKADVAYRIKISRRPLFNLPDPLTYCVKPWNARWADEEGNRGRRRRLPLDALPSALLWQDQYTLGDITLLMGLRPGRNGFISINSTRMIADFA